ncbi:MAG: hypothetical protein GX361_05385 [Bacteroidales bacterium]|nr:hypothetical protein [Bacteroidales bacterium]
MKKQHFLLLALFATIMIFASCSGGTSAKEVKLKNQEDSLNYALGIINGEGIKASYFQNDSTTENLSKLLKAADKAFKSSNKDELFNYGKQVGGMLKQQKKTGLMFDSTLVFNEALVIQGLVNGLKSFNEGMTGEEAQMYLQTTMQKRQEMNMPSAPAEEDELKNDSIEQAALPDSANVK